MPVASANCRRLATGSASASTRTTTLIDNHIIEEVLNDDNEHPGFPAVAGRLEQPANRL